MNSLAIPYRVLCEMYFLPKNERSQWLETRFPELDGVKLTQFNDELRRRFQPNIDKKMREVTHNKAHLKKKIAIGYKGSSM